MPYGRHVGTNPHNTGGGIIFGERYLTSVFVGFVIGHLHSAHSFYLNCTDTNLEFSGKVSLMSAAVYTSA